MDFPDLPDDAAAPMTESCLDDRAGWRIVKRAVWVRGVTDLQGYVRTATDFTMDGHVGSIRCPLLATATKRDPPAAGAGSNDQSRTSPQVLAEFETVTLDQARIVELIHQTC